MSTQMTKAAWQRGFKNALICSVGVFVVPGIILYVSSTIFEFSLRDAFFYSFVVLWSVAFATFVLSWLISKQKCGPVLLDCGPHPTKKLFLVNAGLFAFIGFSYGFDSNSFDRFGIAGALFSLTFSIYWVMMSLGRLQIVENGIWMYWGLLKWQKLESYEWKGKSNPTLMFQKKTKLPFLGRGALPVSSEYQDAVSDLLKKHIPG